MYLVRYDFQASSLVCRSFQVSADHQAAAWRARATVSPTSCSPKTGKVATGSSVAGFSESNVFTRPDWAGLRAVATIALTHHP